MLGKLLKYELKATGRLLLPLYGVLLLFSVINRIFFAVDRSTAIMESFFAQLVMNLTIFVYGVVVAAVFVVTFFVLIQRFYKNLLGDEGYLMNTLPVRPWKHIVSKMTVAILWSIVSGIVVTLSIMIMSMQSGDFAHIFSGMGQFMQELWRYFGFSGYWAGIHIVILCLLGAGVSVLMVYAALALGHMANKHKILCSFGWFMAINFVSSMLVSILIRSLSHMPAIQNLLYFPMDYSLAPLHAILWLTTLFVVLFGAVYFLLTNYVMSKRLNLE